MAVWVLRNKKADFAAIAKRFQIREITARLLVNRGLVCDEEIREYLYPETKAPFCGSTLLGLDKASALLEEKIKQHALFRVIGDYDVDGIMASYALTDGLKSLGARVDCRIPDRKRDGYGLNMRLVKEAAADGIDVIVTCDNGIAAKEEIAYAKELGMTVIVTDHHEVPFHLEDGAKCYELPEADVVIDPKKPEECQRGEICGAVVAIKLVRQLFLRAGRPESELNRYLPMAAIATVCDVMDLTGENRGIVKAGLAAMQKTDNLGLRALLRASGLEEASLNAYHLGFVLGPCFNASGRLDTAEKGLRLLLAHTEEEAALFAQELKALNDSRKEQTAEQTQLAMQKLEEARERGTLDKVLVVYLPDCHESLAGIIAGRLKERYHRPAIVLTKGEQAVKGSGRSVEAYSMFEELTACKDLFSAFGGHALAAGLTLKEENPEELRKRLNAQTTLTEEDLQEKVTLDAQLPFSQIDEALMEELALLEPCGKGNTKPVFAESGVRLLRLYSIGKTTRALKLLLQNARGERITGLYFGDADDFDAYIRKAFSPDDLERLYQGRETKVMLTLAFYPSINEYRGEKIPQIIIQNYKKTL